MCYGTRLPRIQFKTDSRHRLMVTSLWLGLIVCQGRSSLVTAKPIPSSPQRSPPTSSPPLKVQDPNLSGVDPDGPDAPMPGEGIDSDEEEAELSLSIQELRLVHHKNLQLGLGEVRPWRTLTIAMGMPVGTDAYVGLDAGFGRQVRNGIFEKKAYDIKMLFQSVGFFGRIYIKKFPNLSYEPSVSLTQWSGDVSPFGVEPEESARESLSGGYEARGVTLGMNLVSTWFLSDDVSLDWTFIGLKKAWLMNQSNTRQSSWISGVVDRVITTPQAYGLTTITFGYWF